MGGDRETRFGEAWAMGANPGNKPPSSGLSMYEWGAWYVDRIHIPVCISI